MNKCVCGRVLTISNNNLSCSICGWSKVIPSGTLVLGHNDKSEAYEEKFFNEKKTILHNNVNPLTYHNCKKCNKVTKQRMLIDDNNHVTLVCFNC